MTKKQKSRSDGAIWMESKSSGIGLDARVYRPRPKEQDGRILVRVHLHHETNKAYGVSRTGPGTPIVWLPKSRVRYFHVGLTNDDKARMRAAGCPREDFWPHVVDVPLWLARKNGLLR